MLELPVDSAAPFYSFRLELSGEEFEAELRWSTRGFWVLGLYTPEGEPICLGVKLVPTFPLLEDRQADPRRPAGEFVAGDPSGALEPIGRAELGDRAGLFYFEPGELPPP